MYTLTRQTRTTLSNTGSAGASASTAVPNGNYGQQSPNKLLMTGLDPPFRSLNRR